MDSLLKQIIFSLLKTNMHSFCNKRFKKEMKITSTRKKLADTKTKIPALRW
jgi:hypothetical protein